MSCCLILQTAQQTFIGIDSAVTNLVNNKPKRVSITGKKFFKLNNMGIFCSGDFNYVNQIIDYIESDERIGLKEIQNFLKKNQFKDIEIIIFENQNIFQLSPYKNYELVEHLKPSSGIQILAGGIKTELIVEETENLINNGLQNPTEIILNAFKRISCDEVGGKITIYKIDKKILHICSEYIENYKTEKFIVGEIVVGKLIAGNSLLITNEGTNGAVNFTLDENGCVLSNASLKVNNTKNEIVLDPTNGFYIANSSGTKSFYVDTSGNLHFTGDLTGSSGTFSGTLSASTITGSTISGSTITGTTISGGTLTGTTISGGSLSIGSGKFTVSSSGACTASSITITGGSASGTSISASTITGGSISGTTITGTTISGNTITGGTIKGTTISGNTISGGTISGTSISGGTISGASITGGSISITNNATLGQNLTLGTSGTGYVSFGGGSNPKVHALNQATLELSASQSVSVTSKLFVSNVEVTPSSYLTATNITTYLGNYYTKSDIDNMLRYMVTSWITGVQMNPTSSGVYVSSSNGSGNLFYD